MKKLVASVGLVALGVSSVQTLSAQSMVAPDPSKPWSVSATLRGFYDDNFNTVPKGTDLQGFSKDTFGWQISPSIGLNLQGEQTMLNAGYTYSYKKYTEDSYWDDQDWSASHEFDLAFKHAFSPRCRLSISDGFVIGQEPDQLVAMNTLSTYQYVPGDNYRNYGTIDFGADITRTFGIEIGYANAYFNYENDNDTFTDFVLYGPSMSGLLDRLNNMVHLDGRITLSPSTVGIIGYQFSQLDYTADELIGIGTGGPVFSDDRNNRSHYGYLGVDHAFATDLSASLRAGARFNDYYNDPQDENGVSPYLRGSLRWTYAPQSYVEGGIAYDRTATDVFGVSGVDDFVRDQNAGTIFGTLRHQILPKLFGMLNAQFQNATINGGPYDEDMEQFYLVGVNLEYQFNRYLAAHVGYNYDNLQSDIQGRPYDRNRVYLGVTAAY